MCLASKALCLCPLLQFADYPRVQYRNTTVSHDAVCCIRAKLLYCMRYVCLPAPLSSHYCALVAGAHQHAQHDVSTCRIQLYLHLSLSLLCRRFLLRCRSLLFLI